MADACVAEVQELDRVTGGEHMGQYVTPDQAAEELDGRGGDGVYAAGGEPPKLIGNPITALVLSREGR